MLKNNIFTPHGTRPLAEMLPNPKCTSPFPDIAQHREHSVATTETLRVLQALNSMCQLSKCCQGFWNSKYWNRQGPGHHKLYSQRSSWPAGRGKPCRGRGSSPLRLCTLPHQKALPAFLLSASGLKLQLKHRISNSQSLEQMQHQIKPLQAATSQRVTSAI